MLRMRRGPSTNICTAWAIGIVSRRISAAIEFEFYENNEKWFDVDESVIGGIPRSSERDR
jgi:hypothetical protein